MEISVYGSPACARCKDVINFLQDKNVGHIYKIIGEDIDHEHVNTVVGRLVRAVPVIMMDGNELTFDVLKEKINSINSLSELEL